MATESTRGQSTVTKGDEASYTIMNLLHWWVQLVTKDQQPVINHQCRTVCLERQVQAYIARVPVICLVQKLSVYCSGFHHHPVSLSLVLLLLPMVRPSMLTQLSSLVF